MAVADEEKSIDAHITKEEDIPAVVPVIQNIDNEEVVTKLSFNDLDSVLDESNNVNQIDAPKTIERLEEISTSRAIQRKLDEQETDDEDRIQIHTDPISLSNISVLDNEPGIKPTSDVFVLNDVEELF